MIVRIRDSNTNIVLVVEKERYEYEDDLNTTRFKPFTSDIRLAALYRQYDKNKHPASKGETRRLLCDALQRVIDTKEDINYDSIIVVEADGSPNGNLVKKVYIPMGFERVTQYMDGIDFGGDEDTTLMKSKVGTLINWCNTTYKNPLEKFESCIISVMIKINIDYTQSNVDDIIQLLYEERRATVLNAIEYLPTRLDSFVEKSLSNLKP